jgi:hypothetical protein
MPELTGSVGEKGDNKRHDVTLVEAILRLVKNAKNVSYYQGTWDGAHGKNLKKAITSFQTDKGLLTATPATLPATLPAAKPGAKPPSPPATLPATLPAAEQAGLVGKDSKTFKALVQALHDEHAGAYDGIRVLPNTKMVYLAATQADLDASVKILTDGSYTDEKGNKVSAELEPGFRAAVIQIIKNVYQKHKFVLGGWGKKSFRRPFAWQHDVLVTGTSKAHPGESFHQYGQAIDMGFKGVKWLKEDGVIRTITSDVNFDSTLQPWQRTALYEARNKLAEHSPRGTGTLFRIWPNGQDNDPSHIQGSSQEAGKYPGIQTVHMQKSLAAHLQNISGLLDTKNLKAAGLDPPGAMQWKSLGNHRYGCDMGFGGAQVDVGTADQIWMGNAGVSKAELAQALTAAAKAKDPKAKAVAAATITAAQVAAMQQALKGVFLLAEQHWAKWVPVKNP